MFYVKNTCQLAVDFYQYFLYIIVREQVVVQGSGESVIKFPTIKAEPL